MSRKYNKKGDTALLDDDSLSTPVSTRDAGRRSGGGRSSGSKRREAETVTAPAPPEVEEEEDEEPQGFFSSKTNIIGAVVSVLVILAIIAGVAWFLLSAPAAGPAGPGVGQWGQLLLDTVNRTALATNFAAVTAYSTLAGTVPSAQAVRFVNDSFLASFAANSSIADVSVHRYYGLFNYPSGYDPNSATPSAAAAQSSRSLSKIVNGTRVFTASLTEDVIAMDAATSRTDAVPTCNKHSPPSPHSTHGHEVHQQHIAHSLRDPLTVPRCLCTLLCCFQSTATVPARMAT